MACDNDNFHRLADEPDHELKEGLKEIDSRLLKTALTPENAQFVDKMLRVMSPVIVDMIKDDIEDMKAIAKQEEASEAQGRVINQYSHYQEKKKNT